MKERMTSTRAFARAMRSICQSALAALMLLLFLLPAVLAEEENGYLWPVPTSRIVTQHFVPRSHEAIDISGKLGDEIVAARAGKVVEVFTGCVNEDGLSSGISCKRAGCTKKSRNNHPYEGFCNYGFGNGVVLKHDDGSFTAYGHFLSVDAAIQPGVLVEQGQVLGKMGTSGRSSGVHLRFSVTKPESYRFTMNRIDPSKVFAPFVILTDSKATDVTEGNANLEGYFSYLGAEPVRVGVCLGTSKEALRPSSTYMDTNLPDQSFMRMYYAVDNVEGVPLQPDTTYYWRCYAITDDATIVYGDIQSFTTQSDGATRVSPGE